jgi:signal peptidase II
MTLRPAVWLVALAVVVVDQTSKWWAQAALSDGHHVSLIGDYLTLQLEYNSGAALSVLRGNTWVVTLVMVAVTVWLISHIHRARGWLGVAIIGLALGGALGNLSDRLFRTPGPGRGEVVDMIGYSHWFVGNVADIAIVGAAAAAILAVWRGVYLLEPTAKQARAAAEAVAEGAAPGTVEGAAE